MTNERAAILALHACTHLPGSWNKRFARSLADYPENHILTAKQRANLYRLVVRYRRQIPPSVVTWANWWLGRPEAQIAFEQAIDENPEDLLPRLVYADWLEEQGTEEFQRLCTAQREMCRVGMLPRLDPSEITIGPDIDVAMECFDDLQQPGITINHYDWTFRAEFLGMISRFETSREKLEQLLANAIADGVKIVDSMAIEASRGEIFLKSLTVLGESSVRPARRQAAPISTGQLRGGLFD